MMYGTLNSYSSSYTIYNSTNSSTTSVTNMGWMPASTVKTGYYQSVVPSKPAPKNIDVDAWSDIALGSQD